VRTIQLWTLVMRLPVARAPDVVARQCLARDCFEKFVGPDEGAIQFLDAVDPQIANCNH
jgi:hypothetical protein